jgi:hypothetical protein
MKRIIQAVSVIVVLVLVAGIVWAAKDPAPGSRDDPIVTKSYVDQYSAWRRVQIPSGGAFEVAEGTEWVVVFASDGSATVTGDKPKLDKVFDLTLGMPLGDSPMLTAHHYLCAASDGFTISFIGETQLLVRGGS